MQIFQIGKQISTGAGLGWSAWKTIFSAFHNFRFTCFEPSDSGLIGDSHLLMSGHQQRGRRRGFRRGGGGRWRGKSNLPDFQDRNPVEPTTSSGVPNKYGRGGGWRGKSYLPDFQDRNPVEPTTSSGGTGRHPPHLRGRDIGLFYANKYKKRKPEYLNVKLDQHKEQHLSQMLNVIRGSKLEGFSEDSNHFQDAYDNHLAANKQATEDEPSALIRKPQLDKSLQKELCDMRNSSKYKHMLTFREKLPAYEMREEIVNLITNNQVAVISGETGCGKTTQVSQFILDSCISKGDGSLCHIVVTQPRRISAISVAERVAKERAERCGNGTGSVGWQIRLEKKLPRREGSIVFCTTGILLQRLKHDSLLQGISHIILDEIHERDLDSDFLMIIVKDLLSARPDLKLVLMSATLNAEQFSKYFGSCPMMNIHGLAFPVQRFYLEDVLEKTGYVPEPKKQLSKQQIWKRRRANNFAEEEDFEPFYRSLVEKYSSKTINSLRNWDEEHLDLNLIVTLIKYICTKEKEGAILTFLPGWDQISKLNSALLQDQMFRNSSRFIIIPLHSMMPILNQQAVFDKPPPGVRKIIIATNIAETSITIDDVVYVIDSGKTKMSNFDIENNIETLKPEWISLANAKQRKGRAGRVQPGICFHLFMKARESTLEQYALPEMLRTRLETLCLKIKILKLGKITTFLEKAMNPPEPRTIQLSIDLLTNLTALDSNELLTPLGFHLARLPLDPLTGRLILFGAMFSCLDPILTIAASLSFKDAFHVPLGKEKIVDERKRELAANTYSDHLMLAKVFKDWEQSCNSGNEMGFCRQYFLSGNTLKMLKNLKKQLAEYLQDLQFIHCPDPKHPDFNQNSKNELLLKAVICAGLYPNVALTKQKKIGGPDSDRMKLVHLWTKEDGRVTIHPRSVNSKETYFPSPWLVYYQKLKSSGVFLHDTTMVHPYALLFFGGKLTTGKQDDKETISVDDWIVFNCASQTAKIVIELRSELEKLMEYKITHPNAYFWNSSDDSREKMVLLSILELITSDVSLSSYGAWSAGYESDN